MIGIDMVAAKAVLVRTAIDLSFAERFRMYQLEKRCLDDFLKVLCSGHAVYALRRGKGTDEEKDYRLERSQEWLPDRHTLGACRPVQPLKTLVFPPREFLGTLHDRADKSELQERIVLGVKGCDLAALKIHDHVFLHTEPVDPSYRAAREKTTVVSCDCTDALETCFCTAVGDQPYPATGFDINLSPLSEHCIVEAGSQRGKDLLQCVEEMMEPAGEAALEERSRCRQELAERIQTHADEMGLPAAADLHAAVRNSANSELWEEFAEDCVECGACNLACCTCHCFLLADGQTGGQPGRTKLWDSCLYRNFATVAGGANPRSHRADRLYNRFDKKFNFFPETIDTIACDGCGRCIEACTGRIDIREVLKRCVDEL